MNVWVWVRNILIIAIIGILLYGYFPFPPMVWRIMFVVVCLVCIVLRVMSRQMTTLEKSVLLFVGLNVLHYMIAVGNGTAFSSTTIGNVLFGLLALSAFAFLADKGVLTNRFLGVCFAILLITIVKYFYDVRDRVIDSNLLEEDAGITNNAGITFLMLLPWLFLIRKKWLSLIGFLVCIFYIVYSAKRGSMVSAFIPVCLFILFYVKQLRGKWRKGLFFVSILLTLSVGVITFFQKDEYLQQRLAETMEGNSSQRDRIYREAWNLWCYADEAQFWHGHGYLGCVSSIRMMAHNDWLEILVDYGVIGVICYGYIFYCLFALAWREKEYEKRMVLLACLSIWLTESIYSMAFLMQSWAILCIPLGYVVGNRIEGARK